MWLAVQSVPVATKVVSSNAVNVVVYPIQHYVIKLVSDLRQGVGFLQVLRYWRNYIIKFLHVKL
jgi:hypothetical protein